ncbi:MAG: hypothetical protein Q9M39_06625 [Sulfurovum sp.]|nr:hypothetical protein [Sulfurovum sp.]
MYFKRLILVFLIVISTHCANDVNLNVRDKGIVKYDDVEVSKLKFAKEIGYPIYPSCLFFDKNGELVYDGVGFRDEKQFLYMLKLVSSNSYHKEDEGWDK